jgi:hypothetical protein
MYARATSVPDAVREIISGSTVYLQSLQLGIANYTALAQKIKPDVEKITGSKVNANTIVVAIKRFADALEVEERPAATFKAARMSLTGNIIDVDFEREFDAISGILDQLFDRNFSIFQTGQHIRLFAEDVAETRSMVNTATKKFDGKIREGLAKINIQLASSDQNPYDILSMVSNLLYNNHISIQDAFFTPTEIVLILGDKDAAWAYELLRTRMK